MNEGFIATDVFLVFQSDRIVPIISLICCTFTVKRNLGKNIAWLTLTWNRNIHSMPVHLYPFPPYFSPSSPDTVKQSTQVHLNGENPMNNESTVKTSICIMSGSWVCLCMVRTGSSQSLQHALIVLLIQCCLIKKTSMQWASWDSFIKRRNRLYMFKDGLK